MKVIAISDTHTKHDKIYKWLEPADMIICAGDISSRGYEYEVKNFLAWYSALPYQYKILIAGNHDFLFEGNPEKIKEIMPENIIYLENSSVNIEGHKIYGSPITPFFYDWAFNRHRGAEIKPYWDKIDEDTEVLITHGPPKGVLDYVHGGSRQVYNDSDNVGCADLSNRINELKNLKVHIFGHIHDQYGDETINGVRYLNASFLNDRYEPAHRPHIFEL